MSELLDLIEAFNRKERFFVFTQATDNPVFMLGAEFRTALSEATGTDVPPHAKAYIDYHLDWLHAAVKLAEDPTGGPVWADTEGVANGNQQDIDLLVAYAEENVTWLILVEAKAYTGWISAAMRSKAKRLSRIFGNDGVVAGTTTHPVFCLWSPAWRQPGLIGRNWPKWMLGPDGSPAWLSLTVPDDRKVVMRSDPQGRPDANGEHWTWIQEQHGPRTWRPEHPNWDGKLPLAMMLDKCRESGNQIDVGHSGGERDLLARDLAYLAGKTWKWRDPATNKGTADRKNWIPGRRFAELVGRLQNKVTSSA